MEIEDWKIDILFDTIVKKIEKSNKRKKEISEKKETIINELKKLKKFDFIEYKIRLNIGYYFDHLNEIKKIDEIVYFVYEINPSIRSKTPREIYEKSYKPDDNIKFPKKWKDLFILRWSTDKLEELYTSVKIEKLKFYLSHYELEEYLTYNYYDKVINVNNYYLYEKDFNKYFGNYQRLKKI